jgi:hypothetical protein
MPSRLIVTGRLGVGKADPEDALHVGDGPSKAVIGGAAGVALGYGTSYLGFNAARTGAGWRFAHDGADNGGGVVYGLIGGQLALATRKTTGAADALLTDQQIHDRIRLLVDGDGNVGIGTRAPQTLLHVAGDLRVDGHLTPASSLPIEVVAGHVFLAIQGTGSGNSGTSLIPITSSLPNVSYVVWTCALSDIYNQGYALDARWRVAAQTANRVSANKFELPINWTVRDTDGWLYGISWIAVFVA